MHIQTRKMTLLLMFAALTGAMHGCNSVNEAEFTPIQLISNPSFEHDGAASLTGWSIYDSASVGFDWDVPPGGGRWSLRLKPSYLGSVRTTIPAVQGSHHYKFSFWAKNSGASHGAVWFLWQPAFSRPVELKGYSATDTVWSAYTFLDSLHLSPGDSLTIQLLAAPAAVDGSQTLFDLCEIEQLD